MSLGALKKRLFIFGSGGHAHVVADTALATGEFELVAFVVKELSVAKVPKRKLFSVPEVFQQDFQPQEGDHALVGIGDNWIRKTVFSQCKSLYPQLVFPYLLHPGAQVSPFACLQEGTVCLAGSVVQYGALIEANVVLNTGACVDHDCHLGAHSSIGPGVRLGGNVDLGELSYVGMGANVLHGVSIGPSTVVGAASLVLKNLPSYHLAYGSPCRVIRSRVEGERYL